MNRWFGVGYSAMMCLAFGAVALFVDHSGHAQLVWAFGAGVHLGMGIMWAIVPFPDRHWHERMRAELDKLTENITRVNGHIAAVSSPPLSPDHERRL